MKSGLGAARHQVEKFLAAEAQRRPQQLQSRDEEEGNEAGRHRHFFRLDGDGRQIGDEDGGYQLFGLQFAQLTLAHQPHGEQNAEIDEQGAENQKLHEKALLVG